MKKVEASAEQKLMGGLRKLERSLGDEVVQRLSESCGGELAGVMTEWWERGWRGIEMGILNKKVGGRKGRGHEELVVCVSLNRLVQGEMIEVRMLMRTLGEGMRYHGLEEFEKDSKNWKRLDSMRASQFLARL